MEEMKELKNVVKSVRITETEYAIVMQYKGRNFNDKLENILLDTGEGKEKGMSREIDNLYMKKQSLQNEIEQLQDIKESLNCAICAISDLKEKMTRSAAFKTDMKKAPAKTEA